MKPNVFFLLAVCVLGAFACSESAKQHEDDTDSATEEISIQETDSNATDTQLPDTHSGEPDTTVPATDMQLDTTTVDTATESSTESRDSASDSTVDSSTQQILDTATTDSENVADSATGSEEDRDTGSIVDTETADDTDTGTDTNPQYRFDAVDILLVIDNSVSMQQEQEILATAIFSLVNTLINPLPTWDAPGADDVRIGVTTTDMGVHFDGGVGPDISMFTDANCEGMGDNGALISDENSASSISILANTIPCDAGGIQCPTGWMCGEIDTDGVGTCREAVPNDVPESCPTSNASPDTVVNQLTDWGNDRLAFSVACKSAIGINGCNYEQQLYAGTAAMNNNPGFLRADALTVILIISDEEDCSIESNDFFDLSELNGVDANLACGNHKDLLYSVAEIKEQYTTAKQAVSPHNNSIVFAAIIGVPLVEECQGKGNTLNDCLNIELDGGTVGAPDIVQREVNGNAQSYFEWACERYLNDESVIQAYPGARYVELAQLFGEMGYIYSICNEDWNPAMENIAEMIVQKMK